MTTRIKTRDWEALSAYLDHQLSPKDRVRLESRLNESPELRSALEELRRTRAVLRSQPRLRAPRNFTLTPEMAGIGAGLRPGPRSAPSPYPVLRLAAVLATIFFVFITIGDLAVRTAAPAPMTVTVSQDQPVAVPFGMGGGSGGGSGSEAPPAPAAVEAPAAEETVVVESSQPTEAATLKEAAPTQAESLQAQAMPAMASEVADQSSLAVTPLSPTETPIPFEAAQRQAPAPAEAEGAAQPMENIAPTGPGAGQNARSGGLSGLALLRILQFLLAALAIGAGLAALYVRRSAR